MSLGRDRVIGVVLPHSETKPISKRDAITEILDEKTHSILRSVTSATCVLVDPDDFSRNARPISPCVDVSADDLRIIATLLLDHESWFFAQKRCLPKSTAILTLSSPIERITILIGMSCADWEIRTAHRRIGGFFDPVAGQIRGMLKRTFPDIASPNSQSMWRNGAIAKLRRVEVAEQSDAPKSPNGAF
jgi:hypothetical protein